MRKKGMGESRGFEDRAKVHTEYESVQYCYCFRLPLANSVVLWWFCGILKWSSLLFRYFSEKIGFVLFLNEG